MRYWEIFLVLLGIAIFSVVVLNCEKTPSGVPSAFITVTYPNGGEYWAVGIWHRIQWKSEGVKYATVFLSRDGGNSWEILYRTACGWGITTVYLETSGDTSSNCLIKVGKGYEDEPSIYDISDSTFTITSNGIKILSPNGGEVWLTGTRQTIIWKCDDEFERVGIQLSRDGGNSWERIVPSVKTTGWCTWEVGKIFPSDLVTTPSTNCIMKVTAFHYADRSDSAFTIVRQVKITSPTGTEFRYPGDTLLICWITSGLGGAIKIEYSTNSGLSWYPIISSTPDTGWYSWEIPDTPGDEVKVKLTHLDYTEYFENSDVSFGYFTILRHLQIKAPKAGDTLYTNQPYDIKWNTAGVSGKVRIDYYNGVCWDSVTSSVSDTGSFTWLVPNTPTDSAKIKITHLRYPNNIATSGTFTIAKKGP